MKMIGRIIEITPLCLGILGLAALAGCSSLSQSIRPGPDVVDPRLVVALLPMGTPTDTIRQAAEAQGYVTLDQERLRGIGQTMVRFHKPTDVTGPEAIAMLEAAEPASVVGINHAYRVASETSLRSVGDYASQVLGWPVTGCRARHAMGMIDTAVSGASGLTVTRQSFAPAPGGPTRHGTEVATVLTDPTMLRGAQLYSADVFGSGTDSAAGADALVRALDWLASENVRLVNISLAGPFNKLVNVAVTEASARGVILVAAVGNSGPEADRLYPAGFEQVIAVTAVDANREIYRNAVRGPHVDLAAPGVDVFVGDRFVTGTSIAAPFVTARLAAMPDLPRDVASLRARLGQSAQDLGPEGRDPVFGAGLLTADPTCR